MDKTELTALRLFIRIADDTLKHRQSRVPLTKAKRRRNAFCSALTPTLPKESFLS
jgi:hypothetical protein